MIETINCECINLEIGRAHDIINIQATLNEMVIEVCNNFRGSGIYNTDEHIYGHATMFQSGCGSAYQH